MAATTPGLVMPSRLTVLKTRDAALMAAGVDALGLFPCDGSGVPRSGWVCHKAGRR